jgi:hypothetical protein
MWSDKHPGNGRWWLHSKNFSGQFSNFVYVPNTHFLCRHPRGEGPVQSVCIGVGGQSYISLRGLHVERQAPWQRPLVASFQRLLRWGSNFCSFLGKGLARGCWAQAQEGRVRAVIFRRSYYTKGLACLLPCWLCSAGNFSTCRYQFCGALAWTHTWKHGLCTTVELLPTTILMHACRDTSLSAAFFGSVAKPSTVKNIMCQPSASSILTS